MIFKGCCTALVTPLTKDGRKVNYKRLMENIDFQIKGGVRALVFLGTTGAPATLSKIERERVIRLAVEYVNGRVPVIAGAGNNCTAVAIKNSQKYESLGVDALLHVTPYYNKCTQRGLIEHFTAISKRTRLPIILYNVPGRTGVNILPQTVEKLSHIENIVAIKEASGNVEQTAEIVRICRKEFVVYSGDDGLTLPILSIGGSGVISVAANIIPKLMSEICSEFFDGNIEGSRALQLKVGPLIKSLFSEVNPIPIITAMNLLGMEAGGFRLPLTHMEENNFNRLKEELTKLSLIEATI